MTKETEVHLLYLGIDTFDSGGFDAKRFYFYVKNPTQFTGKEFDDDFIWANRIGELYRQDKLLMVKKPLIKGSWPGTVYIALEGEDYVKLKKGERPYRYPNPDFCQLIIAHHTTATNHLKMLKREKKLNTTNEFKDELERLRKIYLDIPYQRQPMFLAYVIKYLTRR